MSESGPEPSLAPIALVGLFVTALVTAQLISSKLLAITIPVVGVVLQAPGGTVAYAATYFASDCISELYGESFARRVVNVGFVMNFVMLALVLVTIELPIAQGSTIGQEQFATVLGSGLPIVLGSLFAYVASQNWDVVVFHRIRNRTGERLLWVRNIGSTVTSQLVDTVIFTVVAFAVAPALLGSQTLPTSVIVSLIVGQYVLKFLIALADTPFVYAAVGLARSGDAESGSIPSAN